jgi:Trehalose synthase, N-terminal domain
MLVSLLGYARGASIDARWAVIGGNERFFALTKRIHNRLHGFSVTADRSARPSDATTKRRSLPTLRHYTP